MLLVRQPEGVNSVRIFLFSQIVASLNPDATDELRYLGKSNLEAWREFSPGCFKIIMHFYIYALISFIKKDLELAYNENTCMYNCSTVDCMTKHFKETKIIFIQ